MKNIIITLILVFTISLPSLLAQHIKPRYYETCKFITTENYVQANEAFNLLYSLYIQRKADSQPSHL